MKRKAWPYILVSFLIMGLIFYFSSQTGTSSSSLSALIIRTFLPFLKVEEAQFFIRKLAHFSIYFGLGFCVFRSFYYSGFSKKKSIGLALLLCILYSASDEWHQTWISGRSGQLSDIVLDSFGSFCSILLASCLN